MSFEVVSVIGLGYIGLPTAAMFAKHGKKVIGVDVSEHVIETVNRGKIHIIENDLEDVVKDVVDKGALKATKTVEKADAFLIAVPTPFVNDHEPDLSFIKVACRNIAPVLKAGDLIILESTSPVGTTEQLLEWLSSWRSDLKFPTVDGVSGDISIAYCPERVLPGHVIHELVKNDRIIGGVSAECSARAVELYKTFVRGECVVTNARTAEMAKLTENSFRDVNIAFANELSLICNELNINVWELISLANRHPRVDILNPGPGVGGHCIAVDPWFIVSKTPDEARLIRTAREVNDRKPLWVLGKIKAAITDVLLKDQTKQIGDVIVACYGLSFKANIDDLRESPALSIAIALSTEHTGAVLAVEPHIEELPVNIDSIKLVTMEHARKYADVHVLLVDHDVFIDKRPEQGIVLDTRGYWLR